MGWWGENIFRKKKALCTCAELIFVTNITNFICGEKLSCGEILGNVLQEKWVSGLVGGRSYFAEKLYGNFAKVKMGGEIILRKNKFCGIFTGVKVAATLQ